MCLEFEWYIQITAELIDTLWNVNLKYGLFMRSTTVELIDTLWNVNELEGKRYMSLNWN